MTDKKQTVESRFEMFLIHNEWVEKHISRPKDKTQANMLSINSVKIKRK